MRRPRATLAASLLLLGAGCAAPPAQPPGQPSVQSSLQPSLQPSARLSAQPPARAGAQAAAQPLDHLASAMAGSFSSRAQSLSDARYLDIELQVARIWPERSDGPWLYVEQASADARDKPYRQRIYRLQALAGGELVSWVYTLPGDPLAFAGAATQPARLGALQPAQLQLREGCEVRLRAEPAADGQRFVGSTQGQACRSDLRGATHASSDVQIDSQGMRSWDRGFDANHRQVWGATAGAYRFDRVSSLLPTPAR
jgi:CpeT protein